jgi:ketosteroid isomerase-like protein
MTDDELEQLVQATAERVRRLEDIQEIKALHHTYIRDLADRRWDDMLENFTADAMVDLRRHGARRGHAEIAELFAQTLASENPHAGYLLTSPVIEVHGDTATGEWTRHCHLSEFPVMGATLRVYGPWWEGRYHCTYRREEGRWKFVTMRFRVVLPDPDLESEQVQAASGERR